MRALSQSPRRTWELETGNWNLIMRRIAILCCVSLIQACLASAEEPTRSISRVTASSARAMSPSGPLRKASLRRDPETVFLSETRRSSRATARDDQQTGNWMERHPVWTGALIGFGIGVSLTYAAGASEKKDPNAIFKGMDPSGPALVFGGVAAGIGALAGWGIGRDRDRNPSVNPGVVAPARQAR
jgi:hypothetical protein